MVFEGDAPVSLGTGIFPGLGYPFTIYYHKESTGFISPTWQAYRMLAIDGRQGDYTYSIDGAGVTVNGYLGSGGAVTIPDTIEDLSVRRIEERLFSGNPRLTGVSIPDSVTSIGNGAFWDCINLTSVTIGNGVTSIGHVAFGNCWSVSSLTIGTSVRSIGSGAFTHCRQLARAVIPDSVTSIESGAFSNCDKLVDVTIGTSVTSIGDAAFSSCRELTSATFRGNAPASFGEFVFLVTSPLFAVYYYEGSTGFTSPTWQGYNAVALPAPVTFPIETWRKQHFGAQATNTGEAADIADPDGDGLTNRQEFAAGTDPKSAASTLKVKNALRDGATFTVILDALPSRVYELQRLIPAPGATWQFAAAIGPLDTAGTVALTDQSASADTALYRVVCQFNP